jgi:hypothetical protein
LQGCDPEKRDKLVNFVLHFDFPNDPGAGENQDATRSAL